MNKVFLAALLLFPSFSFATTYCGESNDNYNVNNEYSSHDLVLNLGKLGPCATFIQHTVTKKGKTSVYILNISSVDPQKPNVCTYSSVTFDQAEHRNVTCTYPVATSK